MAKNSPAASLLDEIDEAHWQAFECLACLTEISNYADLTPPIGDWNAPILSSILLRMRDAHSNATGFPEEFACHYDAPLDVLGMACPSYHEAAAELVGVVLMESLGVLYPFGPDYEPKKDITFDDLENASLDASKLSGLVAAVCFKDHQEFRPITQSFAIWLGAAIDQEYCKAICLARYGSEAREIIQRRPRPTPRFQPPKCPKCGGQSFVQRTKDNTRWLKCSMCDKTFKRVTSAGNGS